MRCGKTLPENERAVDYQTIAEKIRTRKSRLASLRPPRLKDSLCRKCKRSLAAEWNTYEKRWTYPGRGENGLCVSCERKKRIKENIQEHLKRAGVPPRYISCSFDNFKVAKENEWVVRVCKSYTLDPTGNLLLYGRCGTGKTHMAIAITRELLLECRKVLFTSMADLIFELKKTFRNKAENTEEELMVQYLECEYLVVDDFGIEKTTEWVQQTANFLICKRDNNNMPTIVTSNLSPDDIGNTYGDRVASRLIGDYGAIHSTGPDYRLNMAKIKQRRKFAN
jgi:DNA replication protein DnaC